MPQEITGALDASGRSFAIVVSRFNDFFTRKLLEGAVDALLRHGADENRMTIVWVPGTFEVPQAVRRMALSGGYDAVIGLGLVLRGDTSHHEHVAGEATRGIAEAARVSGVPCPLGIVTCDSMEQAIERCGSKQGNRGWDAAMAAIEMSNLMPALGGSIDLGAPAADEPAAPAERVVTPRGARRPRNARRKK